MFVPKGRPQNAAAVLHRGSVVARYAKHHLPNYGVFDEFRIFTPGTDLTVVRLHGVDIAIAICEDLWQDGGPVALTRRCGAELLLVLNGSPYERDKDDVRRELVTRRAAEAGCTLAYVNMVGGQDDLVFDGDSIVVAPDGRVARPGAAVRRAPARRRPRPAAGRRARRAPPPSRCAPRAPRGAAPARLRAAPGPGRTASWRRATRSTGPWSSACATTCARTASVR